jgi:hypothetical protein
MTFATAGNFGVINQGSNDSDNNKKAIAELITFPDITGRDAPGKTGAAAKPALVSNIGLFVSGRESGAQASLSIWDSLGKNRVTSSTFTLQNTSTPVLETRTITDRAVFSSVQYYVGFNKQTLNRIYYWAGSQGTSSVRFSKSEPDFRRDGNIGFSGSLGWRLGYDVLPTAPVSPSGTISGVDINLSWSAPASDGGRAVTGYRIQRSTDGVTFSTLVANTNSTGTTYSDTNLTPGRTYTYRVAAINAVAIAHGADYSGPYATTAGLFISGVAGNLTSKLTATVANPEPNPIIFSDSGNGIPFSSISVQYGSEFLYNEVEASTQNNSSVLQVASAPFSKSLYGVRTYAITNLLNSTDQGAFEVAKDYLTYFYEPQLRVDSVSVNLTSLSLEQRLQVLALEIDDYISISFTPNNIGEPKISSGLITGISHQISLTTHQVELRLRNERNLFTLNSDSKGILNVNILGP